MSHQQPGPAPYPQQPQGWTGGVPQGGTAGAQPGYGFPQQPQTPPQTHGQQTQIPGQQGPYGQQPPVPGQPGPYGQQFPYGQGQPNGSGGGGNKTALIVVAAVAALALLGGGLWFVTAGGDDEGSGSSTSSSGAAGGDADPTAYKLTLPDTLLSGAYTLDPTGNFEDRTANPDIVTDGLSLQGKYHSGRKQLALTGIYGTIKDPERTVDTLATSLSTKLGGGPVTSHTPAGFDGDAMKCGSVAEAGQTAVFCVWGDAGTVGNVIWMDGAGSAAPAPAEFAGTTARIRNEVRVEK